jgi:hypothetical protein
MNISRQERTGRDMANTDDFREAGWEKGLYLMRHANIEETLIYAKPDAEQAAKAVLLLDEQKSAQNRRAYRKKP